MKAVGVAVAAITEILSLVYELTTWKNKLKSKISVELKKWQDDTIGIVIDDLAKLREDNINTIRDIADDIAHTFDDVKADNVEECYKHYVYAQEIGKTIGIK